MQQVPESLAGSQLLGGVVVSSNALVIASKTVLKIWWLVVPFYYKLQYVLATVMYLHYAEYII